jgi:hypothetical protein
MIHPPFHASQYEWLVWVDKNYPFDRRNPRFATGFDVLRACEDRQLAADMAMMLCRALPLQKAIAMSRPINNPPLPATPERDEEELLGDPNQW